MNHVRSIPSLALAGTIIHTLTNQLFRKICHTISIYPLNLNQPTLKTIQTTVWKYSEIPNALLFDFSGTQLKLKDIESTLKPHAQFIRIIEKSSSILELRIKPDHSPLTNQIFSILKHQGLYLEPHQAFIKPTLTLLSRTREKFFFWNIQISGFPTEFFNLHQDYKIKLLLFESLDKRFKELYPPQVVLWIENIIFSKFNEKSKTINILLKEEKPLDAKESNLNTERKLIYIDFLHKHLPISFSEIK